jgi:hypothetical protein
MNLELVTTIFGALLQQQQQQLELVLLLLWVRYHSTGLHGIAAAATATALQLLEMQLADG